MTWLTHAANLNPDDDKPNNGFDKREFRRKRRLNEKVTIDKKGKCMEKLLEPIAKRKSEVKIVFEERAEMKTGVTPLKETETSTKHPKEQRTTKSQRKNVKRKRSRQINQL